MVKKFSHRTFMYYSLLTGLAVVANAEVVHPVSLVPSVIFAPAGFDDNDNAQLVVSGNFPTTCYKAASPSFDLDVFRKKIVVRDQAFFRIGPECLEVAVPYIHTLDLNQLPAGSYDVFVTNKDGKLSKLATLPVAKSSSSEPEDSLYAIVNDVDVDLKRMTLTLKGKLASPCFSVKEVKILHRTPGIVEVLPLIEVKKGVACQSKLVPFEAEAALDQIEWKGDVLFHVRSMNGQSLNQIVTL